MLGFLDFFEQASPIALGTKYKRSSPEFVHIVLPFDDVAESDSMLPR
jgi:hypothetical protein